jgi:rhodanese-related sulfurtransferase
MALLPMDLVAQAKKQITECNLQDLDLAPNHTTILIDVREPQEAAAGMLPGAMNIPRGLLEFNIHTHPQLVCDDHPAITHAAKPIVVYCQSGGRSALAANSLAQMGFTNVVSLSGGYQAWLANKA